MIYSIHMYIFIYACMYIYAYTYMHVDNESQTPPPNPSKGLSLPQKTVEARCSIHAPLTEMSPSSDYLMHYACRSSEGHFCGDNPWHNVGRMRCRLESPHWLRPQLERSQLFSESLDDWPWAHFYWQSLDCASNSTWLTVRYSGMSQGMPPLSQIPYLPVAPDKYINEQIPFLTHVEYNGY